MSDLIRAAAAYIEAMRAAVPWDVLHPAAECAVHEYLSDARNAVERGDMAAFARACDMVDWKIRFEHEIGALDDDELAVWASRCHSLSGS